MDRLLQNYLHRKCTCNYGDAGHIVYERLGESAIKIPLSSSSNLSRTRARADRDLTSTEWASSSATQVGLSQASGTKEIRVTPATSVGVPQGSSKDQYEGTQ